MNSCTNSLPLIAPLPMMIRSAFILFLYTTLLHAELTGQKNTETPAEPPKNVKLTNDDIYSSVVRIECATQVFDYKQPWSAGRFGGGIGTGFLIGENQFLTNAHVVSNASRILINKRGSDIKHPARILHIAHDCDLALLEVEDFSSFKSLPTLKVAQDVPQLESEVKAVGYPVGGNRLSVTRGVVSRIDFRGYSHSQIDMHLIVQIDAAINPGNSGGPVLQGDQVVGVAFQGLTTADNTGYMIPAPVIERFIKDISDGSYDKYVDLGARHFSLFNPAMKAALGLAANTPGVMITDVTREGPCDGVLQRGDILTKIDGNRIDNAGNILISGEKVLLHEVVERKFAGDSVHLEFLRGGATVKDSITLAPFPASRIFAITYDEKPRYFFKAGLLFQPLNFNLFSAYKLTNPAARQLYHDYVEEGLFKEREDLVVLTNVFDDFTTADVTGFSGKLVHSINGTPVKSLEHLYDLLNTENQPEFIEIRFEGSKRPLILRSADMKEAHERIAQQQGITISSNL